MMTDTDKMPFGKHKGEPLSDVPDQYLLWLWNQGCSHQGLCEYILDALSALEMACPDVIVTRRKI